MKISSVEATEAVVDVSVALLSDSDVTHLSARPGLAFHRNVESKWQSKQELETNTYPLRLN